MNDAKTDFSPGVRNVELNTIIPEISTGEKKNPGYDKLWHKKNPDYNKTYNKNHPWVATLGGIRSRCMNKSCASYESYGGKGIKNFLRLSDLEYLWHRDKAYNMHKPSIDRRDNKEHYTIDNCRYIELKDNKKRK